MPQQSGLEDAGRQRLLKDGSGFGKQEINLPVKWSVLQRLQKRGSKPPSALHHHLKLRSTWNRLIRAQKNQSTVRHKNLLACARTRVMWYFTKLQLCKTADSSALCNRCIGIHCNLLARAHFEFSKPGYASRRCRSQHRTAKLHVSDVLSYVNIGTMQ